MVDTIQAALSQLTTEGDLIHGTEALVESIKAHTHYSYKKIGEMAGVTEQGVRRWRENNSGKASLVQALVSFAQSLITSPVGATTRPAGNAADALRAVTPLAVQTCVKEGLEALLGIGLNTCTIVKLEASNGKVSIELALE
ncbi:hypothetical protein [Pseudomonas sp. PDM30]|uniref:hypothetical protein n=1 Tax=Pseudomonas sp. PDM30 TaxID=2854773 RepID=UPI001C46B6C7|nr:hypothetical protein [Pseudomonas sp. PDM30]MBV7488030.1 hypothetical protein [Pseudomonas sp. PDM30]